MYVMFISKLSLPKISAPLAAATAAAAAADPSPFIESGARTNKFKSSKKS